MVLRPARTEECAALTDLVLRSKAHWGYSDAFMESCREELAVTPERLATQPCFVLERDGRPVGIWALDLSDRVPEVALMFADPAVIGSGAGRILWQHMAAVLRRMGHDRVQLDADPNAEPFYERMGCRQIGTNASPSTGRILKRYEADASVVLTTKRLILRCYAPGEDEALYPIMSDPVTMRFWPQPYDREGVAGWVNRWIESYAENGYGRWAMTPLSCLAMGQSAALAMNGRPILSSPMRCWRVQPLNGAASIAGWLAAWLPNRGSVAA